MECFLYEEWMDDKNHPKRVTRETNDKKKKERKPERQAKKGLSISREFSEREREREKERHTRPNRPLVSRRLRRRGREESFLFESDFF